MLRISLITLSAVLMTLPVLAADTTSSRQQMRNLDSATKMHGLLEADHGRIYGWGQRDNYSDVAKANSGDAADDDKKAEEQRPSPVHRFHPHAEEDSE